MERLTRGYTNHVFGDGKQVTKYYRGPDAKSRCDREHEILNALRKELPVPKVISVRSKALTTSFVAGEHGQDLIMAGFAAQVLEACGQVLRKLHTLRDIIGLDDAADGRVLVHGDFGPNNVLVSRHRWTVAALLDWEWAHIDDPIVDLAWCEWVVRTHHPTAVPELSRFFSAYGIEPVPWSVRKAAMLTQCERMLAFAVSRSASDPSVKEWGQRLEVTRSWQE